jgi:hypothetical protein
MRTSLATKISQLAQILVSIDLKQKEAVWLRNNIARELLRRDLKRFQGATVYKVKETTVKSHVREKFVALRMPRR